MPDYSDEPDETVAAAAICLDCNTLAFAYRPKDIRRDGSDRWEFMCPDCGTSFAMPERELVFQSLPEEWLLAKVYAA